VLEQYNSLSEAARKLKLAMSVRLRAAAALSPEAYKAAVEEFRATYPNNPTIDLLLIDGYVLQKEYDKALASIDATERFVGGDGYLNVLRAGVLFQSGYAAEALKAARAASVAEPDTPFPYMQQFSSSVQVREHASTLEALLQLRRLRRPIKDLTTDPLLADFVASPQYADWQKTIATP
jgi:predicted Zn-dependent protease